MTQVFTMHFVCSKTDKPFKIRFERENANELFTIVKAKRMGSVSPGHRFNETNDTQSSFTVSKDELDFNGFCCPWCNHDESTKKYLMFVKCGRCKKNICGGNSGRIRFRCRSSCGNKEFMMKCSDFTSYMGALGKKSDSKLLASPQEKLTHSSKSSSTSLITRD